MPDRPLTVAAYAAGASLAAVTLVYVFGPTFFLDDDAANSSKASRRKGVVGLVNPANDCFINSILQTLAGLPELRVYLIREVIARRNDARLLAAEKKDDGELAIGQGEGENGTEEKTEISKAPKIPEWKQQGLQQGLVTIALKEVLDALNERPIYKKTISASTFVGELERAFRTRVNRSQQDAQEFLQVVTERLCDEYHAADKVRKTRLKAIGDRQKPLDDSEETIKPKKSALDSKEESQAQDVNDAMQNGSTTADNNTTFPFEGRLEAQIECMHCHLKPKPTISTFVTLTLHVPQAGHATSLSACFDGVLKVEHIDDFKCEKCRLDHALQVKEYELAKAGNETRMQLESDIEKIKAALLNDPEQPPKDANLPDISQAPKRKIARHVRISSFPRVLAIHLSRSMFDLHSVTTKNLAKVSFPETLPLGGLLDHVTYRLLGVVTHKGGHNSGHYESFRRQILQEPFSTPNSMSAERASPSLRPQNTNDSQAEAASQPSTPMQTSSPTPSGPSDSSSMTSQSSKSNANGHKNTNEPTTVLEDINESESRPPLQKTETQTSKARSLDQMRQRRREKKQQNRWWRISDDKIKEASTKDVLGMQREVYLLFYEIVDGD